MVEVPWCGGIEESPALGRSGIGLGRKGKIYYPGANSFSWEKG